MACISRVPFTVLLVLLVTISASVVAKGDHAAEVTVMRDLSSMQLAFTENQGQWDEKVLFRADAGGATMWFTKDGAVYQFARSIGSEDNDPVSIMDKRCGMIPDDTANRQPDSVESIAIKAIFVGSNPNLRMVGEDMLEYKCNYFIGNDPDKWRTDVPNYSAVVYEDIYAGIDLKYYGNGKQMEYDFIVSPGTDPSQIMVRYEGAKSLSVDAAGRLVVETEWGEVIEQQPVVYQMSGGDRVLLVGEYVLKSDTAFGFELPDGYNPEMALVIDPVLEYSTYLGGTGPDYRGYGIAVDSSGAAYVTGSTSSTDFPAENPYQTDQGYGDVFVTKLSSSGSSLIYSTYLGGGSSDFGYGISVDALGNAYVTGYTMSTDFPTENPYQTDQDNDDVFVTKLSSSGNSLIYSTYLGGGGIEYGKFIAVDASGAAYVMGHTNSTDFPTENPYQTVQGGLDVFVTKLSNSGSSLVYSTYLGGYTLDAGCGIAVNASGEAYVTGYTESGDFPTENPYQTKQPGTDVFVTKFSNSGDSLIFSTFLGGSSMDRGYGIAVDATGAAYVTGHTWSSDYPTENPYQTAQGDQDVFVTKLSNSGSSLVYSTYLGGGSSDHGGGIAVDVSGAAYVTGYTISTDFPTENPYQTHQGNRDVFVAKLSSSGSSLVYSTYLGGSDDENGSGIAVTASGKAYVSGETYSTDFPTENPYQTDQGGADVYVARLFDPPCNHDGIRGDADYSMTLDIGDLTYLVAYFWQGGDPPPCPEEGDVDGSGGNDIGDLTYLVAYIWQGGSAPAPCP